MAVEITNRRTIADIKNAGENVTLIGNVVINSGNTIETIKGNIVMTSDNTKYIGNFSELGVNVQGKEYTHHLTESSNLLNGMIQSILTE